MSGGEDAAPLISAVRKQPFTVLLLDEFEKAHENVWDSSCRCSTTGV